MLNDNINSSDGGRGILRVANIPNITKDVKDYSLENVKHGVAIP